MYPLRPTANKITREEPVDYNDIAIIPDRVSEITASFALLKAMREVDRDILTNIQCLLRKRNRSYLGIPKKIDRKRQYTVTKQYAKKLYK